MQRASETDRKRARVLFADALQLDPDNTKSLYGLARLAYDENDLQDANELLEELLENDPEHEEGLLLKCKVVLQ